MFRTGNTTTTQMSQKELELRFLSRTRVELEQMRACLPDSDLPVEPMAMSHMEQLAAKISSTAEAFGFAEITVIAGAIELLSQGGAGRKSVRDRIALVTRLKAQLGTLEAHLEFEMAERAAYRFTDDDPEDFSLTAG